MFGGYHPLKLSVIIIFTLWIVTFYSYVYLKGTPSSVYECGNSYANNGEMLAGAYLWNLLWVEFMLCSLLVCCVAMVYDVLA